MRRSLPRLALPLGAYLFIALLLPIFNGALSRPGFAQHCLAIAQVCGGITLGITVLHMLVARFRHRRNS